MGATKIGNASFSQEPRQKRQRGKVVADSRVFKPEIQLSFFQIEVGEKTRTALYKLTTDQQKMALKGMKHFYLDN